LPVLGAWLHKYVEVYRFSVNVTFSDGG
jgi:hypothetical protein